MPWTFSVGSPLRNPTNFNIDVLVTFSNSDTDEQFTRSVGSVDLTDDQIAEWARKIIRNVLEIGDATLASITVGLGKLPADPPDTSAEVAALNQAAIDYQAAVQLAQVKALGDPAALQALTDLQTAQATLKDAQAAAVEVGAGMTVGKGP